MEHPNGPSGSGPNGPTGRIATGEPSLNPITTYFTQGERHLSSRRRKQQPRRLFDENEPQRKRPTLEEEEETVVSVSCQEPIPDLQPVPDTADDPPDLPSGEYYRKLHTELANRLVADHNDYLYWLYLNIPPPYDHQWIREDDIGLID